MIFACIKNDSFINTFLELEIKWDAEINETKIMKMLKRKIFAGLSIGIIIGFIVGLFSSFLSVVIPNDYFTYKMYWLIALSLSKEMNKWVMLSVIFLIILIPLFYVVRFTGNLIFSKVLEINVKDKNRLDLIIRSYGCGFLFLSLGGWAINHYLLPQMFHPLSLIGDFGILIFSVFLGWMMRNIKWAVFIKSMRRTSFVFACFIIILNLGNIVYGKINVPQGPNIILISVETLRPDHLSCYGYARDTSPNVDLFAKGGILFENCFSHSASTGPSCSSILSGFFPHETKVLNNVTTSLPLKINTIAELLKNNGYATVAIVSNYIVRRKQGFNQGFEIYNDELGDQEIVRRVPERIAKGTTESAIKYLKKNKQRKFFMWIHYQDPHGPYTPPPPFDTLFKKSGGKSFDIKFNDTLSGEGGIPLYQRIGDHRDFEFYVAQYDGEIRYFDSYFGTLMNALKELDLYDGSFMIFTADHGEGMGENNFYFAHEEYLYNSLIHVPLILRYRKQDTGMRENYVQHINIVPTIFKVAGISTYLPFRGHNLLGGDSDSKEIYSEQGYRYSIIIDKMKLVYSALNKEYFLFDLRKDFREEDNIINDISYRDSFEKLRKRLEYVSRENSLSILPKPSQLSAREKEKLESLGYIK